MSHHFELRLSFPSKGSGLDDSCSAIHPGRSLHSELKAVPCTEEQEASYQRRLQEQEATKLSSFWERKLEQNAVANWDRFYKNNKDKFFKDRHYLASEFPELANLPREASATLFEVGCGVGNAFWPLLKSFPHLRCFGVDCSARAILQCRQHPEYNPQRCQVFVGDLVKDELPAIIRDISFATLIFVLSAIHPDHMVTVLKKVYFSLAPAGVLFIRDYAVYDLAQLRFGSKSKLGDHFYARGDGTRSFFFSVEKLTSFLRDAGFLVKVCGYAQREVVNAKLGTIMQRNFIQARCVKLSQ
eukprot:g58930.t1